MSEMFGTLRIMKRFLVCLLCIWTPVAFADYLDGQDWMDLEFRHSDYGEHKEMVNCEDSKLVEIKEMLFSRMPFAIDRLKDEKFAEIPTTWYGNLSLSESDIPDGTRPYLVRGVLKLGHGSMFDVRLCDDVLVMKHICINEIGEGRVYKYPLLVFLKEPPREVRVYNWFMGW